MSAIRSIDALLNRQYDAKNYHCVHFVIDAAKYLFELDYTSYFLSLAGAWSHEIKQAHHAYNFKQCVQLDAPKDGCVVLMTNLMNNAHVGLYYQGRVLHIAEQGVYFQELRSLTRNYSGFKFYEANHI